jgi:hypothetical protein
LRYDLDQAAEDSGYGVELVTSVTAKISSAPQSSNCNTVNRLLTDRRREEGFSTMSPADAKVNATIRTVTGSFLAGVAAMVMLSLVPVAVKGGLSIRDAWAATADHNGPAVEPINVAQVRAQIAAAQRSMEAARQSSQASINRLDRLAGR